MINAAGSRAHTSGLPEKAVFRRSTLALLIAFLPLAFSEDLLGFTVEQSGAHIAGGPGLVAVDLSLYLVIAVVLWPVAGLSSPSRSRRLFMQSLLLTILLDIASGFGVFGTIRTWSELASVALYMIPQTLLYMAIAVTREQPGASVERIWVVGGPLLIGTTTTWVLGVLFWPGLQLSAGVGITIQSEYFAPPRVNQEYFAQAVQLIPVLLIALAVELRFFQQSSVGPPGARQARTAVVAAIGGAGCLAAVLALPRRDGDAVLLDNLSLWAEYMAWLLSINAISVAIVALVWALVADRGAEVRTKVTERHLPERVVPRTEQDLFDLGSAKLADGNARAQHPDGGGVDH